MEQINNIIHNFEQRSYTHPNISKIWKIFLKYKLYKLKLLINQSQNILDNIDNEPDITNSQMLFTLLHL